MGLEGVYALTVRLLRETNLSIAVALRFDGCREERQFFDGLFDGKAVLVESDRANFSTYRAIDQSRLAITLNSSSCWEALGWHHKVLFCNPTTDEYFAMPKGLWYIEGSDYEAFRRRVLEVLEMPQDEYVLRVRDGARYIMNFDPENPPHRQIRKAVLAALG